MPPERADVVIVGGGLLGLATARALCDRREVVVLERRHVGHHGGGSHGPSRVFRLGYDDPFYVRLAQLSLPRWRELEARTGASLLEVTGQLSFGETAGVARAMREAGAPAQRLDASEIVAAFPMFAGHGAALYEPASGVIDAAETLAMLRRGVEVREQCAVTSIDDRDLVRVQTDAGAIDANVVVLTAGPWTRTLRPDLVAPDMYATREHVAYLQPRVPVDNQPVFIDYDARVYGLPTPGSDRYKIALHHGGEVVEPDDDTTGRVPAALEAAARTWLPDHELVEFDTCIYDNTPNEDFVLQRSGNVVVGTGTSGHGFKFGPLLGELLASLAEQTAPLVELARFDPSRRRV